MKWTMIHNVLKIHDLFAEKLVDEPVAAAVKPPKPVAVNKWEGEDEDEVKVSLSSLLSVIDHNQSAKYASSFLPD